MPDPLSGGITITPGKILAPGELVSNAKLNQGFRPVGRVDEGAITARELDTQINDALTIASGQNLFCNGDFILADYFLVSPRPLVGVIPGGHSHDYGSANRWVTANDAHRTVDILNFSADQIDVPDFPLYFLRWTQSTAVGTSPAYLGQRLENVRRFSGQKVTLSLWVRASAAINVTPSVRQYFGDPTDAIFHYSAGVITTGTVTALTTDTWTKIVATFTVPSVAGKIIDQTYSFTEFRIEVPQGSAFQIDFAHAQLEMGGVASRFDPRSISEDVTFALRYYEIIVLMLSTNVTAAAPFANTRMPMFSNPNLILTYDSGSGGNVGNIGVTGDCVVQTTNHTLRVPGQVIMDAEIYG